jgi:outer membrane protein OmpA-like peptidoglycan-associated protein
MSYLNLFPRERLNYYAFAGFGIIIFQPQEISEAPQTDYGTNLLWKDFGTDDQFKATMVGGFGVDYYLTRNFSVGLQGSFRYFKTDLLDAFEFTPNGNPTASDHFFDYGLKITYYMFESTDSDGDGLSNEEEIAYGTNPYKSDSDDDQLSDYEEIYTHKTSPVLADTDGDGIFDFEELTLNINPNKADTDGDGLADFEEIRIYKTFAHLPDSDYDDISDYDEVRGNTNPLKNDTDGDGIYDGKDECPNSYGLKHFNGCPQNEPIVETRYIKDTLIIPMDTIFIVKEVSSKSNFDTISKQFIKPFGINFMKNSAEILIESELILDDIAKWVMTNEKQIEVHGHTDSDGDENFNLQLSYERALSVREYLINQGVDPKRVSARGFGEYNPIDIGESRKAKARNRRIEFVLTD